MAKKKMYIFSSTGIDNYLHDLKMYIAKREGDYNTASRMLSPLIWYVNTGRASSDFLKALMKCPYFSIYVILRRQDSVENTIRDLTHKLTKRYRVS